MNTTDDFYGVPYQQVADVAAAFGMAVERVEQDISNAIRELIEQKRHLENMQFLEKSLWGIPAIDYSSQNGVCVQQRRGREKPEKRPFLQVVCVANNRKMRTDLKDFIRYGRA